MLKTMTFRTTLMALACALSVVAHAYADSPKAISVPAGDLVQALESLAKQCGVDVIYASDELKGAKTQGVTGTFGTREAFTKLLEGSSLTIKLEKDGAILITSPRTAVPLSTTNSNSGSGETPIPLPAGERADVNGTRLAQATNPSPEEGEEGVRDSGKVRESDEGQELPAPEETDKAIPEILVKDSRSLNMDIRRTRDDPQPYVVFDRERIERSGARTIEGFLKQRLPMNTVLRSNDQINGGGNISTINLRGLGTDETLILVDGHRLASNIVAGVARQPDITGIPLAAVERIEVLPTTASGIYGGSATGGVINIVLKRDFTGIQFSANYENTFESDAAARRFDFSGGLSFEGGKSNVLVSGSWSDQNVLSSLDRSFPNEYYATSFNNNPAFIGSLSVPFGATTNIGSVDGSNLRLDNGTLLPSPFTHVPYGYAGPATDGGVALIANAGTFNLDPANSAQSLNGGVALLNSPTVESVNVTVRRQFMPWLEAFLDVAASNNIGTFVESGLNAAFTIPGGSAGNPFQQAIRVQVPSAALDSQVATRSTDRRLVGGLIAQLPANWRMEVDYSWDQTEFATRNAAALLAAGSTAIANGTINVLRDTSAFPLDLSPYVGEANFSSPYRATLKDAALRFAGPLLKSTANAPHLSLLLEHREEAIEDAYSTTFSTTFSTTNVPTTRLFPGRSQSVDSAYLELRIPVVSPERKIPFVQALELQVAGRYDDYETDLPSPQSVNLTTAPNTPVTRSKSRWSSADPTIGLRWTPLQDIVVRASYGTGFLPPGIDQLAPPQVGTSSSTPLVDPRRGNSPFTISSVGGTFLLLGNPNLHPEESESWSAGLILTPRMLDGLRLSVDYTRITKSDNIASMPGSLQGILNNEGAFPERVIRRDPTPAEAAMGWAGVVSQIDATLLNLSSAEIEAYDLQLDYQHETAAFGRFDFYAVATWQTHFKVQALEGLPIVENVGFDGQPVQLKGTAGLSWEFRSWTLGWTSNYWDSYLTYGPTDNAALIATKTLAQGSAGVEDQIYHDVFARFRPASGASKFALLSGVEVSMGVKNVLNTVPPQSLQSYSGYGDPRLATYWITLQKSFGDQ